MKDGAQGEPVGRTWQEHGAVFSRIHQELPLRPWACPAHRRASFVGWKIMRIAQEKTGCFIRATRTPGAELLAWSRCLLV